jgi:hypothetical protein
MIEIIGLAHAGMTLRYRAVSALDTIRMASGRSCVIIIARSVGSMGVPTNVARPIMSFRGFSTNYVAEPRKMMHSSFVEYDYPCGGPVSVNRYQECASGSSCCPDP